MTVFFNCSMAGPNKPFFVVNPAERINKAGLVRVSLHDRLREPHGFVQVAFAMFGVRARQPYINTNQQDRAIAEYRNVLARRGEDVTAHTLIGMIEDSRKNYDAAAEQLP